MIPEKLKKRLRKDRPMVSVTLRMPQDVVDSLKTIAPLKGMAGYQSLLKAYVSEGLRRDEEVHLYGATGRLLEALKRLGVAPEVIEAAARDAA